MNLTDLSNEELLSRVSEIIGDGRRVLARLIAYLGEVEDRRLDLASACSSLFDFCVTRLGMSPGEAFRRINAARLARRFPSIPARVERGEVHLSALVLLRDFLTNENHEELLREAAGKTKREVQEMLAARFPKPDIPSRIRAVRSPRTPKGAVASATPPSSSIAPPPRAPATVEPLSPARYKVEFTVSAEVRDKLVKATALMRHRNPTGDLALVIEDALDLLLAKLEKDRLGKPSRSRPRMVNESAGDEARTTTAKNAEKPEAENAEKPEAERPRPEYIPVAVRREVFERDAGQCTFVDAEGRRCPARAFLELDHIHARALGGTSDASNLRLLCRAHNLWMAERTFGRAHVEERIRRRQRKCQPARQVSESRAEEAIFASVARALETTDSLAAGPRPDSAPCAAASSRCRVRR